MNRLLQISASELKLLLRNRTAASTALLLPLLLGAYFVYQGSSIFGENGWPLAVSMQILMMLGFTVYITSTTALTARRQDLYLKRLRSGEVSDGVILGGILLPLALVGVLQSVVLLAGSMIAGAPAMTNPLPLVAAVLGGTAMCTAVGALTSGVTGTAESAQITTTPFFFAIIGGAIWVLVTPPTEVNLLMLAVPGGAIADLVRTAFADGAVATQLADSLPAIGLLLAWTVIAGFFAMRVFRWEPRK